MACKCGTAAFFFLSTCAVIDPLRQVVERRADFKNSLAIPLPLAAFGSLSLCLCMKLMVLYLSEQSAWVEMILTLVLSVVLCS